MRGEIALCARLVIASVSWAWAFEPDQSPQPPAHPPMTPEDGSVAAINPPPMIWRLDDRAATYTLELCRGPEFAADVTRVERASTCPSTTTPRRWARACGTGAT